MKPQRSAVRRLAPVFLAAALLAGASAHAQDGWRWNLSVESGRPSGWVQVRENAVEGTRLHFADDLNVNWMHGIQLGAVKTASEHSEWHFSLASYSLAGSTTLSQPIVFNGAVIAPGSLRTDTKFVDYLRFDAAYWRRLADFGNGARLWGSAGVDFVLLNFKLKGTVAPDSPGHETKEDFYVQELPVPVLGLHLQYPFTPKLSLLASAEAGRLPPINSLRREGGLVRLAQTHEAVSVGLADQFTPDWQLRLAAFSRYFAQSEQSGEDGNVIHFWDHGLQLGFTRRF